MRPHLLLLLCCCGCLVNKDLYEERLDALSDADGDGFTPSGGDCDDADPTVYPGGTEVCDGKDNDCNDSVDDSPVDVRWYPDSDSDSYGVDDLAVAACEAPAGYVAQPGDCDDDDCDGTADEAPVIDASTWYLDADEDGWGDAGRSTEACAGPEGYVATSGDCDDFDASVHPDAPEICGNGIDDDCDEDAGECRWGGDVSVDDAAASFAGTGNGDHVGASIAALGDLNGDGVGEVALGAYGTDTSANDAGRTFVFPVDLTGELTQDDAIATIDGTVEFAFSGWTLAAVDDFDKDGIDDLLIGANNHDQSGAAFLMTGPLSGALTTDDALVQLVTGQTTAELGGAVADGGDPIGDGYGALLVGAAGAGKDNRGAAYLLAGLTSGTVDVGDATTALLGASIGDAAGFSVASGDFDGDGLTDVAVGAVGSDLGEVDAGAVYIVLGAATGTLDLSDADLMITGEATGDLLGARLVSRGDGDDDGYDELVGSAPHDDTLFNNAGALFVLDGETTETHSLSDAATVLRGAAANQLLGAAIDIGLDHNGDAIGDLVVGTAPTDGSPGRLRVFYGPLEGMIDAASSASFVSDQPDDGTGFSAAMAEVSPGGDVRLLVGATERNDGAGAFWITETSRP